MKAIFFIMIGMIFLGSPINAKGEKCDHQEMDKLIESIDANEQRMEKTTADILTGTDYGGYFNAYFEGSVLMKIKVWIGLSNKEIQTIYYFNSDKLFMAARMERFYYYNERLGRTMPNMSNGIRLLKYYFKGMNIFCSENNISIEIKLPFEEEGGGPQNSDSMLSSESA